MKKTCRRGGFSLVELLTVIAIIAILAAIIFPVMGVVKRKAQENNCLSNLHQIYLGLDLYKRDNRKFPPQLCAVIPGEMFENAKGDYLYPEPVNNIRLFHCPTSKVTKTNELVKYPPLPYGTPPDESEWYWAYAYNSYECYAKGVPSSSVYTTVDRQYAIDWAPDIAYLEDTNCSVRGDGVPPGNPAAAQRDYERQLKFRNPPSDTVLTWCMWHANDDYSGRALVVFLDGHASSYDARIVRDCKWRTNPKKE